MNVCILMERLCRVNEKYAVTVNISDSPKNGDGPGKEKALNRSICMV